MDIFTEPFFQRAIIGGLLIGLTAPLMGVFLVLRRLSMIGDTLAHVSIAGVALGFLINVYPIGVGLLFALLASFAIEHLRKAYKTYAELSIAIIMSGGVALATFLFTMGRGFNVNVMSYFFGSIYTLDNADLWIVGIVAVELRKENASRSLQDCVILSQQEWAREGGCFGGKGSQFAGCQRRRRCQRYRERKSRRAQSLSG